MKPTTLKPFKTGYGDEKICFYPRMATVAEQNAIERRLLDISDSDELKYQKEFEIYREAVAEWSADVPKKQITVKGEIKYVEMVEGAETPQAAIDRFFAERTAENERVVRWAYNIFVGQFQPEADFL